MSDPFQAALEAMFEAPGSAAALYVPGNGPSVATRTIRSQPDQEIGFGRGQVVLASNVFLLMRSVVPAPTERDVIQLIDDAGEPLAGGRFNIAAEPTLDVEGLSWTCAADPEPV